MCVHLPLLLPVYVSSHRVWSRAAAIFKRKGRLTTSAVAYGKVRTSPSKKCYAHATRGHVPLSFETRSIHFTFTPTNLRFTSPSQALELLAEGTSTAAAHSDLRLQQEQRQQEQLNERPSTWLALAQTFAMGGRPRPWDSSAAEEEDDPQRSASVASIAGSTGSGSGTDSWHQWAASYLRARTCVLRALELVPSHATALHTLAMYNSELSKLADMLPITSELHNNWQLDVSEEERMWWTRLSPDAKGECSPALEPSPPYMGETEVPRRASSGYLVELFDTMAETFDTVQRAGCGPTKRSFPSSHAIFTCQAFLARSFVKPPVSHLHSHLRSHLRQVLEGELKYDAHKKVRQLLEELGTRPGLSHEKRWGNVLDLGCGTGLNGPLYHGECDALVGVDLSAQMLAKADSRGVYTRVLLGDLDEILPAFGDAEEAEQRKGGRALADEHFDLILATDTLIYFGDLHTVFRSAASRLSPSGRLAVSLELLPETEAGAQGSCGWRLQGAGTFAHTKQHVCEAAEAAGMAIELHDTEHSPRTERGEAVKGQIVILGLASSCAV